MKTSMETHPLNELCETAVVGTVTAGLDVLLREHVRLRLQLAAAGLSASERITLELRQAEIESCYRERLKALNAPLAGAVAMPRDKPRVRAHSRV